MSELIDNRAHRIRTMKKIIKRLHEGGDVDEVRQQLKTLVRETDSSEIAAMEQELMAEGMPVEEVQSMCDAHSSVLREILIDAEELAAEPGHPVDTFRRENEALLTRVEKMRSTMKELQSRSVTDSPDDLLVRWRQTANDLMDVEKHYQRKEHLLFSCLERHGITGPSKVMWGKDDEVRQLLATLDEALGAKEASLEDWKLVIETVAEPALAAVEEMIFKEESILLPMALGTLTADEWGEIWRQSPEYGWCLIEPAEGYEPPLPKEGAPAARVGTNEALVFPTGALTYEHIKGILAALPVDITFVDADDRVRYFSEGPERIFARSKAILGRKVQHCHPPKSVDVVERIVSDFRSGERDVASFWINLRERFVHIRYFAVRDEKGAYLGTLEATQNLTPLRALEGERRLLEYDEPRESEG